MYVLTRVLSSGGSHATTAESDDVIVRTAVGWPGAWVSSAHSDNNNITVLTRQPQPVACSSVNLVQMKPSDDQWNWVFIVSGVSQTAMSKHWKQLEAVSSNKKNRHVASSFLPLPPDVTQWTDGFLMTSPFQHHQQQRQHSSFIYIPVHDTLSLTTTLSLSLSLSRSLDKPAACQLRLLLTDDSATVCMSRAALSDDAHTQYWISSLVQWCTGWRKIRNSGYSEWAIKVK